MTWTRTINFSPRLATMAAVALIAGSLGFSSVGGSVVSAQANTPSSRADCRNWQAYGFDNRADCVAFVVDNNNNGYGGGGGGGGAIGSIGQFIRSVLQAIAQIIRAVFAFLF